MPHSNRVSSVRRRSRSRALMEALDRRTLLTISFTFNIIDPTDQFKSIRTQLQTLLNAAGGEWAQHLIDTDEPITLEYDVAISNENIPDLRLASGAAKTAEIVSSDPLTGVPIYEVGTVREMKTGIDPNGPAADAGIVIYAKWIKQFYFDPQLNRRNDPIPANMVDGYSVILHEMAHTLGFVSSSKFGQPSPAGVYTYDVSPTQGRLVNGFEFTGLTANAVYGADIPLDIPNQSHLNTFALADDLMGGEIPVERRFTISSIDLAILQDAGVPVNLAVDETPQGILTINGTGLPDVFDVSLSNGTLLIRMNQSVRSFDPIESQQISAIVLNGLAGDDYILIQSGAPAVAINGGAGNDTLIGGDRGDSITGSGGKDLIYGGKGGDIIRGGDDTDTIYGQGGSDRIFGDTGNDHVDGGLQTDRLFGGSGHDTVVGGTEDDFLNGDAGNDLLSGAGGKDRLDGGTGADRFFGGAGNDSADYSKRFDTGVIVTIDGSADDGAPGEGDNVVDVENVIGTGFDDVIVGSEAPNSLIGGTGADTIDGGGGNDTVEGNGGSDVIIGSGGHDSLLGQDGNDRITGGSGRDHVIAGAGDDTAIVNDGEIDTVEGGDGTDSADADPDDVIDVELPNLIAAASVFATSKRIEDDDLLAGVGLA